MEDWPIDMNVLFLKFNNTPIKNPEIKMKGMENFKILGNRNICWGLINHIIIEPIKIDIGDINIIGIIAGKGVWCEWFVFDFVINLLELINIRIEYDTVNPIDKIIIKDINEFVFDEVNNSIILSLEKNPDVKGKPIRAMLAIPKIELFIGEFTIFNPIIRISW